MLITQLQKCAFRHLLGELEKTPLSSDKLDPIEFMLIL